MTGYPNQEGRIHVIPVYENPVVLLPYTFGESSKLKKEICFQPEWMEMIQDNTVSILGWIQYEKVKWLQRQSAFHLGRTGAVPKGKYAGRVLQHSAKEYAAGV